MGGARLVGKGASPGEASGNVLVVEDRKITGDKYILESDRDVAEHIERFRASVESAHRDILDVIRVSSRELSQLELSIFDSHLYLLKDPLLMDAVLKIISEEKKNAEWALEITIQALYDQMSNVEDTYLKERSIDILDVGQRLLSHLIGDKKRPIHIEHEKVILFAKALTPSDTLQMNRKKILGFVTEQGGFTSHVAILAKALEVPAIVGVENALASVSTGDYAIMDGKTGIVEINPDRETIERFTQRRLSHAKLRRELYRRQKQPTITKDGCEIEVKVNIDLLEEVDKLHRYRHDGVGLCRTEFLYLNKESYPAEQEQYEIYRRILLASEDKPVTYRTLDFGGDKLHESFRRKWQAEQNPFLGCRGIRLSFRVPELFLVQLQALLRVANHGKIQIMFPMISGLGDFILAKNYVQQARENLQSRNIPHGEVELGIMVEVPSAALMTDILARHVDFMSIGTNDLTQYIMAADRMNNDVLDIYDPYNPGMIRIMSRIVNQAYERDCPVSVCGELASDTKYLPILIGMGVRTLSVSPGMIPDVRDRIRSLHLHDCRNLISEILSCETSDEIQHCLSFRRRMKSDDPRDL